MTRWKITIEYDGRDYCGWQVQENMRTIQGSIEDAICKFCQQDIQIYGAGRTDAGVHARGQVAHFDLDYGDRPMDGFRLAKAINAHLIPVPISILKAEEVDSEFHARFHAVRKFYTYRIINRRMPIALDQGRAWHVKTELDVAAMQAAAQVLVGEHDFTSFRDSNCQAKSPIRTLDALEVEANGEEILIHAQGRSFLHHQVRNMAGTLSLVGEGKWTKEDVKAALDACDRTKGGPTAPAEGLYLMRIDYGSS